ncbi:NAD(P)/FAD-dependent oxidoreductase [Candidatus Saganbacteria bacterium]|nr:NAD(P)/FAD-dependent oxidoreductase [Candidatus Saganbacteria bacterium]
MIKKSPKIIIIGAGPVGCYMGQMLKHYGFDPLILEEHPEVGKPVACAGIVGKNVFTDMLLPIPKTSIINTIDGAKISFNGSAFLLRRPSVAYIIDRAEFDNSLSKGLNIEFNTKFEDVEKDGPGYRLKTNNGEYYADILIGADGPNSRVRKLLKFNHNIKLYKGYQYRIKMEVPDRDRVDVGYIKPFSLFNWIIPEGNGVIRVGTISDKPIHELDVFMKAHNIHGDILEKNAGPIPIGTCDLVKDNAALIGDAACQIKPITSGGIFYGMKSAEILAGAIKNGDLSLYEKEWDVEFGKEIRFCLLMRYAMENIDSEVIKKVFEYVKENAGLIENAGDFENHSSVLWSLVANPRTYPTIGTVLMGLIKKPSILFRLLRRR